MFRITVFLFPMLILLQGSHGSYHGIKLGRVGDGSVHGVMGDVYLAAPDQLFITNFSYDGTGPDAFFMISKSGEPSPNGIKIPDENGSLSKLKAYNNKSFFLSIAPHSIKDIEYFAVYCITAKVTFGSIRIPSDVVIPTEQRISEGISGAHGVSTGRITLKDSRTVYIENFSYDGLGPDAFFTVGKGSPSTDGTRIADEKGGTLKLPRYSKQNILLTLPSGMSWNDVDYLSIYCFRARQDFAHVRMPDTLNVPVAKNRKGSYDMMYGNASAPVYSSVTYPILAVVMALIMMRN